MGVPIATRTNWVERRTRGGEHNLMRREVRDDRAGHATCLEHDETCLGVQPPQHARVRLVKNSCRASAFRTRLSST